MQYGMKVAGKAQRLRVFVGDAMTWPLTRRYILLVIGASCLLTYLEPVA